jgi:hypothetical protein
LTAEVKGLKVAGRNSLRSAVNGHIRGNEYDRLLLQW